MSSSVTFALAFGVVGLAALAAYALYGAAGGAVGLLAGLTGLLLGRLASPGRREPAATPEPAGAGPLWTRPPAPGDALIADALLKATMNGMREGVLVLDESLRVVTSNRAARAVFGDKVSARAGQPLSAMTRHPAIHAAYRAALEHNRDEQVKIELWGAERRFFELRVAPLRLDAAQQGAGRGAIGVFFDITRLERLERVRQEFLSNVSHELRTPLTSILTSVETLEGGAIDDPRDGRRFVSVIRRNAERMRTLIEDILELSAIESGVTRVEPAEISLSPAVREALGALSAKAEARGVSLVNEVSAEAVVCADPRRLEQMLLNLIDNAIKFNRAGGEVVVRHEAGEPDRVSVSDTGEGIPADHLPRIFERFYRVDRARAREQGGTGLGLAIVKHLARAHGGEVSVRSDAGGGSTFTVELPRAGRTDQEIADTRPPASLPARPAPPANE